MRQSRAVADHLQRGLGVAARRLGDAHDVFRPRTSGDPLAIGNRLLTLAAAFDVPDGRFRRAPGFGAVVWQGIFDAAYTKPGDYLSGPNGCFFVALQLPLLPPVCVRATRVVTVARPALRERVGPRSYGGVSRADAEPILRNWPVSRGSRARGSSGMRSGCPAMAETALLSFCCRLCQRPRRHLAWLIWSAMITI
jgi:hypothetical protein